MSKPKQYSIFRPALLLALMVVGLTAVLLAGRLTASTPTTPQAPHSLSLSLESFATGLNLPLGIVNAGDDRLFVVERPGRIRIVEADGTVLATPFLDITDRVDWSDPEEGLLGLAFHPNYASNGYFYVNYINSTGGRHSRIARFTVTANPDVADPGSEQILLTVDQPNWNHNAGHILFGPDGYLYIPMGDGGGAGDTANNAQNMGLLLGKISRIDVDSSGGSAPDCVSGGSGGYTVPADNPLVDGTGGVCDEIWASGLRNPWRTSFDRLTGDLFIADVGQYTWEEINVQPAASTGGENYGWRCYEGNHEFNTSGCGPIGQYTFPVFEYNHSGGNCSVSGGYVYRGSQYPALVGHYLLTDYCSGDFWDLYPDGQGGWQATYYDFTATLGYVAFGEGADGELYLARINNGTIYHVVENTPAGGEEVYAPYLAK